MILGKCLHCGAPVVSVENSLDGTMYLECESGCVIADDQKLVTIRTPHNTVAVTTTFLQNQLVEISGKDRLIKELRQTLNSGSIEIIDKQARCRFCRRPVVNLETTHTLWCPIYRLVEKEE